MDGVEFRLMEEPERRQWVENNPEKVNEQDANGRLVLQFAAIVSSPSYVAELIDNYGADVRAHDRYGATGLHGASSPAKVTILLDRGADPTAAEKDGMTPLMSFAHVGLVGNMLLLLMERDTLMTINTQETKLGFSALHWPSFGEECEKSRGCVAPFY